MVKFDNFERRLIKKGIDIDYSTALAAVIFQGYLGEMNNKKYSLDYDASDYLFNDIFSRIFWLLEQREIAADRDVSVPEALSAFMGYAKVLSCAQLECFGTEIPEALGEPFVYNTDFPEHKLNWSGMDNFNVALGLTWYFCNGPLWETSVFQGKVCDFWDRIQNDILVKTKCIFDNRNSDELKELIMKNYMAVVFPRIGNNYKLNDFVINHLDDIAADAFSKLILSGI